MKTQHKFPEFNIKHVQFKFLSSEDIKKRTVCEITSKKDGENSVNDLRLGPTDEKTACVTCGRNFSECSGHEGYIELPIPIINPEARNVVLSILSCVCNHCSALQFDKDIFNDKVFLSKKGVDRLNIVKKYLESGGKCARVLAEGEPPCSPSPIYRKNDNNDGGHMIKYTYKKNKNSTKDKIFNYRTSQEIYDILDNITNEDAIFLGFDTRGAHPRDFMMKYIIVSPTCTRPYLYQDGEKLLDFMTNMYKNILTIKDDMKDSRLTENEKNDCEKKLNNAISNMISTTGESTIAKGGNSKSIRQKLGGKKGIVREKAMGKRINFAGRCVIGGESTLPSGCLLVPKFLASVLTKEVVVTNYNISYIRKLYSEGLVQYITQNGGKAQGQNIMILPSNKERMLPKVGDVIEVSLVNGDIVSFNRQPTLHKAGMMAHTAIIHDQNNIRIHSSITCATNADFDGDDANIYVPQKDDAIIESMLVCSVPSCISDFNTSKVMLSLYYNACLGMYLLSDDKIVLDQEDWDEGTNIFKRDLRHNHNGKNNERLSTISSRIKNSGIHPRSGKALISCMFPVNMYYNNGKLLIVNGVLIKGRLDSSSSAGLIKHILDIYGQYFTNNFISESQWLYDWYLTIRGFTSSLNDITPSNSKALEEYINIQLIKAQRTVDEIKKSDESNIIKEMRILSALARIDDGGKKMIDETVSDDNSYYMMAKSGAKGSNNNIKCMMAMYGQELNNGMRPKFSISGARRITCFDDFDDDNVVTRGFIIDNFLNGLSPQSLVIHLDGSRDGLISSILVTPESGNLNRKMNNFMNSTRIGACGEVELTKNNILQLSFGNGFDVTKTVINRSKIRGNEEYFIDLQNCSDMLMSAQALRSSKIVSD